MAFTLEHTYGALPERFFQKIAPTPVRAPSLICVNEALANELGLDAAYLRSPEGVSILSGNFIPDGMQPIALAYAGHQFGHFVPQLGDGRAILLGEIIDRHGKRRDIQLKGSGPTSFSRRGDGRAALGPVLREYLISEFMAAMGIPTTRSLAAVQTGEMVMREQPLPGAILTRVAASHIRIGTFQFFAARGDVEGVRILADYTIDRHYPDARDAASPYLALLESVIAAQANLIARWLSVGFIHGVMNTDNMSVAGETIDYGPCAFMDAYDPATVFSSIDRDGRYAYGQQPPIALWNLTRFAECLLPLLAENEDAAIEIAQTALEKFEPLFEAAHLAVMRTKIGLSTAQPEDTALIRDLLALMAEQNADFTLSFHMLGDDAAFKKLFADPNAPDIWLQQWRARLALEPQSAMRNANPLYIPRNHLVEEAIAAAVTNQNFEPFNALLSRITNPFTEESDSAYFSTPPAPNQRVYQTFCGT